MVAASVILPVSVVGVKHALCVPDPSVYASQNWPLSQEAPSLHSLLVLHPPTTATIPIIMRLRMWGSTIERAPRYA